MCVPESVSTMSDNSPTFKAKLASSNGFCIILRPNIPKSPPAWNEPQSERCFAMFAKASNNSPLPFC